MAFEMTFKELVKVVHRVLQREFHRVGRGTISRIEEELGCPPGSFRSWRHRGYLTLEAFFGASYSLGTDPRELLDQALPPRSHHPTTRMPAPRDAAVQRALQPAGGGAAISREDLERWDDARYEDPARVAEELGEAVGEVAAELLPEALGVYASARRQLGDLRTAREALAVAFDRVGGSGDPVLVASLEQRLAYVHGDEGYLRKALDLTASATLRYLLVHDLEGVGKTLVDRGRFLYFLSELEESLRSSKAAPSYLRSSARHLFSAHLGSATTLVELGRPAEAEGHLAKAEHYGCRVGTQLAVKAVGLRALVSEHGGDYAGALELYSAAGEIWTAPLDALLASLKQIEMLLRLGRIEEARETTLRLARYLQPFDRSRIVAGAVVELIKVRDRLTITLVRETHRRIAGVRNAAAPVVRRGSFH